MGIDESISKLLEKLDRLSLSTPATTLYAQQVSAKFKVARYSIHRLEELERPRVISSGTASTELLNEVEQVNFYCDCFWDFLRSSIDILAQLINILTSCNLGERSVDIKRVARALDTNSYQLLGTSINTLLSSSVFNTLEEYRHCSMHRRQVYIQTRKLDDELIGTDGYNASTSTEKQTRYISHICLNPWDLQPVVNANQTVATFCQEMLQKLERRMVTIINRLV